MALWPPPEVIDGLRSFPRPGRPGVRWTEPERWHVTLRFLGVVDVGAAAEALAGLRHPPVEIRIGGYTRRLGTIALVVPVTGADGVAGAVTAVTAPVVPTGDRPFLGHLTLARLRPRAASPDPAEVTPLAWVADSVALVVSEPGPSSGPPRYRTVVAVALSG